MQSDRVQLDSEDRQSHPWNTIIVDNNVAMDVRPLSIARCESSSESSIHVNSEDN